MFLIKRLSFLFLFIKCSIAGKIIQDATIFADPDHSGLKIEFSENPDWSDLNGVLNSRGLDSIGSVCVNGPWIMYRLPEYDSAGPQDYAFISGSSNCVKPGRIQSMQPIGSADSPFSPSVTFFTERNFGSQGHPTTNSRGLRFFEDLHEPIRSMIFFGRAQWHILTNSKKSYCLATNFDPRERLGICIVPDTDLLPFADGNDNFEILEFHKGCGNLAKKDNVITIEDCRYFGERRPDPNELDAYRPRVLSKNFKGPEEGGINKNREEDEVEAEDYSMTCQGGKANEDISEFTKLLTIRLNHDFGSPTQLLWPKVADVWKTEIIDVTWDIAMAVIPFEIVPEEYLLLMREFMVYDLSVAWDREKGKKSAVPERFVKTVYQDLLECSDMLQSIAPGYLDTHLQLWMHPGGKAVYQQFKRPAKLDIVADTAWLMANMAMGICHHLFDYTNNFWANYVYTFNAMYLIPILPDWKTMGVEEQFLLGGYDYESQYERLTVFATNIIDIVPNLEPFDRPSVLYPPKDSSR